VKQHFPVIKRAKQRLIEGNLGQAFFPEKDVKAERLSRAEWCEAIAELLSDGLCDNSEVVAEELRRVAREDRKEAKP